MTGARSFFCFVVAAALCSCAGVPSGTSGGPRRPLWVDSVNAAYDRRQYVAAVGYAADRALAEKNALANLAAIFGQSVQADQTVIDIYLEAEKSGAAAFWGESVSMQNVVRTSASMETLVGAEIDEVWFDGEGTWYAAAVMDKGKTARLYGDMIKANQRMIANLTAMNQAEKGVRRCFRTED